MSKRDVWIVTGALLLSNAMGGLDSTIINTALPAIIADLHGLELIGWIVAVFLLGTAVSTPLWSKLGEYIGNKKSYEIATAVFVIGSLFQGMAPNMVTLLFFRVIAGIGNGGMISIPYIIYSDLFKNPRTRMKILGFASASFSTATIIGPLVGGFIVDLLNWRWVLFICVPVGLISILLIHFFDKQPERKHKITGVDYLGANLMISGLVALLVGIQLIGSGNTYVVIGLIVIAAIILFIFFKHENNIENPIIPSRLFKNRSLLIDFVSFALIWGAFISFNIYGPMWAQGLLGMTALLGGATQIPGSITDFIGSELVAPLRNYISPQKVVAMGIITLLVCFFILTFAGEKSPYWILLVAGAFEGFGNGECFNELQVKVQQDALQKDVPVATSFSFLIRTLSQTFTTSIFGIVLANSLKNGIANAHDKITMKMMNELSNASSANNLPHHLLPQMRRILYSGLHNVMLLALIIVIAAAILNIWAQFLEHKKFKQA